MFVPGAYSKATGIIKPNNIFHLQAKYTWSPSLILPEPLAGLPWQMP
jgi:hypothetical protein